MFRSTPFLSCRRNSNDGMYLCQSNSLRIVVTVAQITTSGAWFLELKLANLVGDRRAQFDRVIVQAPDLLRKTGLLCKPQKSQISVLVYNMSGN
jgi:hypothetical protein